MKIKDLTIIEHFTNNSLDEPHTFGEYLIKYENGRMVLVIRNDEKWAVLSHLVNTPIRDCIGDLREDRIEEIKEWLNNLDNE